MQGGHGTRRRPGAHAFGASDKTNDPGAACGAFSYNARMRVTLGLERLLGSDVLRGQRVGIVSNPASVDAAFRHLVDRIGEVPGRDARRRSSARSTASGPTCRTT